MPLLLNTDTTATTEQLLFLQALASQRRALRARKRREARRLKSLQASPPAPTCLAERNRSARQAIGDAYETRACALLEHAGLHLLGRQLSCPAGEIDLVAREQDTLVFVEVRARSTLTHGGAAASVTHSKQTRLIRAISWWLPRLARQHFNGSTPACRIDVIAFEAHTARWLRDAIRLKQAQ